MKTRDDANKKLAEWIEPDISFTNRRFVGEGMRSDGGAYWRPLCDAMHDYELLEPRPYDFYTSEEASALLLEKFDYLRIVRLTDNRAWQCKIAGPHGFIAVEDPDRKTCIANTALKLIEEKS